MKISYIGIFLGSILILSSCASVYTPMKPDSINYHSVDTKNGIILEYQYNVLSNRYLKKESKKGIKLVAVKITNNSDKNIIFGKDIMLEYENGNKIYMMDNNYIYSSFKQNTLPYLLYLLLTPLKLIITTDQGYSVRTSVYPVGYILGPGLAAGNMVTAGSANKALKSELMKYNLAGVVIKKGETKTGIIGIKSYHFEPLRIK